MREDEIKTLVFNYANEYYNVRGGTELMADEAENVIRYILRTHDIIKR